MKRREFLQRAGGAVAASTLLGMGGTETMADDGKRPPNILWITCEDMSPHLGCYTPDSARTPHLDALAAEGAMYAQAFSVSGVCSASRSCLITGMYPSTLGTHHHRSDIPLPEEVRCFPEYLREAGYFCTNNAKTDYNFPPPPEAWDENGPEAHWRNRPDSEQPFFAVFNFMPTHEALIGTWEEDLPPSYRELMPDPRHDPDTVVLPPYYPDTPVIRRQWAHYLDLISVVDRQAQDLLDQLDEDGLTQNTVVFFYSDHGIGVPRGKRWLYDSGIQVPLIVRWPGQIQPGTIEDRLVSFVDFGPTVLSIAGIETPAPMQGLPFLGPHAAEPRSHVYGIRDRMDERYDTCRAVRDDRYKYIRNYEPFRSYAQHLAYQEHWPFMREWRSEYEARRLPPEPGYFFAGRKPLEELYDLVADPHEVRNLATDPAHSDILNRLRARLDAWMDETDDLALVPEVEMEAWLPATRDTLDASSESPYPAIDELDDGYTIYGHRPNHWVNELQSGNKLARVRAMRILGECGLAARPILRHGLEDASSALAYWAALGLAHGGYALSEADEQALLKTLDRSEPAAQLGAALALALHGRGEEVTSLLIEALGDEDAAIRLHAVHGLECIADRIPEAKAALEKAVEGDDWSLRAVAAHALGIPWTP